MDGHSPIVLVTDTDITGASQIRGGETSLKMTKLAPRRMAVVDVGEVAPCWPRPGVEGPSLQIDSNGLTLMHLYNQPSEVRTAEIGIARFGLVIAGRHTLFLLYDIEGLTKGWVAAPLALGLQAPELRHLPARAPQHRRLLTGMLIGARMGIFHTLQGVSLTPAFCAAIEAALETQRAALAEFTPTAHDVELRTAYKLWPDTAAMVPAALTIERGSLAF